MKFGIEWFFIIDFVYGEKSLFYFSCRKKICFKIKVNILIELKVFK